MASDALKSNKNVEMFWAMAIINLKMGNLGLKVWSLKTILSTMEGEKQRLLWQVLKEHEGHEEYKKWKWRRWWMLKYSNWP
jgi:hypothetical protein